MRIAVLRSDLGGIYLSDVENTSQRCFSSEPAGQSRYYHKPSEPAIKAIYDTKAYVALGGNTSATINTTVNNAITITVGSKPSIAGFVRTGASTTKAQIAEDINQLISNSSQSAFVVAFVDSSNRLVIQAIGSCVGSQAVATASGSLATACGVDYTAYLPDFSSFLNVVYPNPNTANVSEAGIHALNSFQFVRDQEFVPFVNEIADLVAPSLVETGPALLSFAYGVLSKLSSESFRPGSQAGVANTHVTLPAGKAVAVLQADGVTPFSL